MSNSNPAPWQRVTPPPWYWLLWIAATLKPWQPEHVTAGLLLTLLFVVTMTGKPKATPELPTPAPQQSPPGRVTPCLNGRQPHR